jgi:ZIP family zinc transporter
MSPFGVIAHGAEHGIAHGLGAPVVAGAVMVALATLAGAWLARRGPGAQAVWFGAAAGALLVIAGVHLLPDAWSDASEAGMWPWLTLVAAAAAFALAAVVSRYGCACEADEEHVSGVGAASALAGHRFLEGAALALGGSVTVAVALAVHALGEGLAVGALLRSRDGRRMAAWLAVMCLGPVVGVLVTAAFPLPDAVGPLLLGFAAGIIAQAARVSLRSAFHHARGMRALVSRPALAVVMAAVVTTLAVHIAG